MAWGVDLARELGGRHVDQHALYLGILGRVGRSRSALFRELMNRVTKKIKDWNSQILSQADKLTLVRSIVQSILTYLMTCSKILDNIIRKIEGEIVRFLWG